MNLVAFITTFITVFLAELGDKTNLAILNFSAESESKWSIFIASSLALVAVTAIGVLAGGVLGKYVNPIYVKYGSGTLFIAIGLFIILKK